MSNREQNEGGGLFGPPFDTDCEDEERGAGETTTGDTGLDTDAVWGGGGAFGASSGCQTSPGLTPWWLAFVLIWGLWSTAFAQDLQTVQPLDGEMVGVRSALHAPRFAPWAVLTHHTAYAPVTAVSEEGRRVLVHQLSTTELSLGWSFGLIQLGITLPHHSLRTSPPGQEERNVNRGTGDILFLLSMSAPMRWGHLDVRRTYERSGPNSVSGHSGTTATLSFAGNGRLRPAGHVGIRMQKKLPVPGQIIGNRLETGLGLHWQATPWGAAMLESIASLPLSGGFLWRATPIELLGAFEMKPSPGTAIRPFIGLGITRGVGAARGRFGLKLRARGHAPRDSDGDGYINLRDACPQRAEDRDGFRDWDGCPEEDNDRDGIVDVEDECPLDAETPNGLLDADGCPDQWPRLLIEVASPEVVTVTVGDEERKMLAGERWEQERPLEAIRVFAEADGHLARGWSAAPGPGEVYTLRIRLEPEQRSELCIQVEDTEGRLLPVTLSRDLEAEFAGRHCEVVRHGLLFIDVESEGFPTEQASVHVAGPTAFRVVMARPAVHLEGRQITLNQDLPFELGDHSLKAVDRGILDALAAWLRANPWIRLIRIEGHADTVGGSAYNYGLSGRRAQTVVEALIGRGVEPERLTPIGWGESEARNGPERSVGFTVLIVDEEAMP